METYMTNYKYYNKSCVDLKLLQVVVHKLSITSFRKPQVTLTPQQQLELTSDSSQVVGFSDSTPTSNKEFNGNRMNSGSVQWRRTRYGRNRQNNNNKLLYALIQLHNHYIHVISFLNKMMTLLSLNQQQQPQQLHKIKRQKYHSKR